MTPTKGQIYTGNHFTGTIEVIEVCEKLNILRVYLTKKYETFTSCWTEDWNLQHFIWGREQGEYFFPKKKSSQLTLNNINATL